MQGMGVDKGGREFMNMSTGRLMEVTRVGCAKRGVVSQVGRWGKVVTIDQTSCRHGARSNQKGGNKEKKGR
jgi:hypothetical protein